VKLHQTIEQINEHLKLSVDTIRNNMQQINDVNEKWFVIKQWLQASIKAHSRQTVEKKSRKKDSYPWFDRALLNMRNQKEKAYANWIKCKTN
jgi:hypothetical protein